MDDVACGVEQTAAGRVPEASEGAEVSCAPVDLVDSVEVNPDPCPMRLSTDILASLRLEGAVLDTEHALEVSVREDGLDGLLDDGLVGDVSTVAVITRWGTEVVLSDELETML